MVYLYSMVNYICFFLPIINMILLIARYRKLESNLAFGLLLLNLSQIFIMMEMAHSLISSRGFNSLDIVVIIVTGALWEIFTAVKK